MKGNKMKAEERWIGIKDVSAHLGVNKSSVYRWIEKKGLPAHRVGKLFRFKLSEVDEWVQSGSAGEADSQSTPKEKTDG